MGDEALLLLASPTELLAACAGRPMQMRLSDGQLCTLRLPTAEEFVAQVMAARKRTGLDDLRPLTLEEAQSFIRPVDLDAILRSRSL